MDPVWPQEIAIWSSEPPYDYPQPKAEHVENRPPPSYRPGPNRAITFVRTPTLSLHRPDRPTGAAVVICPGGGFRYLEIDKEGHHIARALARLGITSLVLKYRTRPDVTAPHRTPMGHQVRDAYLADGLRALSLARENSQQWDLDPNCLGIMGFSAGAKMALEIATGWKGIESENGVGAQPCAGPNFAAPIYPPMSDQILESVGPHVPPVFLAVGDEDRQTPAENCLRLYARLREMEVPSALHIFARARHGFGLGAPGRAVAKWPCLFQSWLADLGLMET